MPSTIDILDTIAVAQDIPQLGLTAGEAGAVVDVLKDGEAYEVEFCNDTGDTYGLYTLRANQITVLHTQGKSWRHRAETA